MGQSGNVVSILWHILIFFDPTDDIEGALLREYWIASLSNAQKILVNLRILRNNWSDRDNVWNVKRRTQSPSCNDVWTISDFTISVILHHLLNIPILELELELELELQLVQEQEYQWISEFPQQFVLLLYHSSEDLTIMFWELKVNVWENRKQICIRINFLSQKGESKMIICWKLLETVGKNNFEWKCDEINWRNSWMGVDWLKIYSVWYLIDDTCEEINSAERQRWY
jgi:hypothetical protein